MPMPSSWFAKAIPTWYRMVLMREAEGAVYPTEQELADIVKQVRSEKLEAYVDNVKQEPLMAQLPKAGKIKKTVENKQLGYKKLTLSNGAKGVSRRPTSRTMRFTSQPQPTSVMQLIRMTHQCAECQCRMGIERFGYFSRVIWRMCLPVSSVV